MSFDANRICLSTGKSRARIATGHMIDYFLRPCCTRFVGFGLYCFTIESPP